MKLIKSCAALAIAALLFCVPAGAEGIPQARSGERTIKNLLATAVQPIGKTLYVWGGGWISDHGERASIEARSIGLGARWEQFYTAHQADYNYEDFEYQSHDGLDCSGYVGWLMYNTLNAENGKAGYVMSSTIMAKTFAERGWGAYTPRSGVSSIHAGDIMSTNGHVYIGIGECGDGSRVLIHSSPPAVQISGTAAPGGDEPQAEEQVEEDAPVEEKPDSEAIRLANYYMAKYWPEHHAKFPDHSRGENYVTDYDQMTWCTDGRLMSDPDGMQSMDAYQVLKTLFGDSGLIMRKPSAKLIIDGTEYTDESRYPLLLYNDVIYFPLTWRGCALVGLRPSWSEAEGLTLFKDGKSAVSAPSEGSEVLLIGEPREIRYDGGQITSEAYPPVLCEDIFYLPLTWDNIQMLGWGVEYENETMYLTTKNETIEEKI